VPGAQVSGRRLQRHGGLFTRNGLVPAQLPQWLQSIGHQIHARLGPAFFTKPPAHVLVNSYKPGQGILPHEDGPSYMPCVAILSLAAPAVFRLYAIDGEQDVPPACAQEQAAAQPSGGSSSVEVAIEQPAFSVVVPPRSLLVFRGDVFTCYRHGIDAVYEEEVDASVLNRGAAYIQALRRAASIGKPSTPDARDCHAQHPKLASIGVHREACAFESTSACAQSLAWGCMCKESAGVPTGDRLGSACAIMQQADCRVHLGVHRSHEVWNFQRGGERVSMTFRNATRELHALRLPSH
jgi:2OG-Fe(II) oxygenase superfamily